MFVRTFRVIEAQKPHALAAAFTFGREDLIPDLFRELVRELRNSSPGLDLFAYYLDRHIEVDGDSHGPMSLRMVSELCGDDETRWAEAIQAATGALQARLALWEGVHKRLTTHHARAQAGR